jgi:hypothetical protein
MHHAEKKRLIFCVLVRRKERGEVRVRMMLRRATFLLATAVMALTWPSATALLHHPSAPSVCSRRKPTHYNFSSRQKKPRHRQLSTNAIARHDRDALSSFSSSTKPQGRVCVAFPGGGLFFYWQAGVIVSANNNVMFT